MCLTPQISTNTLDRMSLMRQQILSNVRHIDRVKNDISLLTHDPSYSQELTPSAPPASIINKKHTVNKQTRYVYKVNNNKCLCIGALSPKQIPKGLQHLSVPCYKIINKDPSATPQPYNTSG